MKLSKTLKTFHPGPEGDLVVEFRRIANKERNIFYAAQLDIKSEGLARGNELDDLRIALFDKTAEKAYILKQDGSQEDLTGDDDKPLAPRDLPEDIKAQSIISIFETNRVQVKNF